MLWGYSIYEIMYFFIIYGFIGWCAEVIYVASTEGKFVNRGFLNGPFCPIYGIGMVIVISCLTPIKDNVVVLFFGSLILTTLLEFFTGFILKKLFNTMWWTYDNEPFNICGFVCLRFSLLWGFACVLVMNVFQPLISKMINFVPQTIGIIILVLFVNVFLADFIATIITILKVNVHLHRIEKLSLKMNKLSNELGESICDNTFHFIGVKEELEGKLKEYDNFLKKNSIFLRLLKAFPNVLNNKAEELSNEKKKKC